MPPAHRDAPGRIMPPRLCSARSPGPTDYFRPGRALQHPDEVPVPAAPRGLCAAEFIPVFVSGVLDAEAGLPTPVVLPHRVRVGLFGLAVGFRVVDVSAGLFVPFTPLVSGVAERPVLAAPELPPTPAVPPAAPAAAPPPAPPPPPPPAARLTALVPANKRKAAKTVPSLRDLIHLLLCS